MLRPTVEPFPVRYLGGSTLLLEYGGLRLLTDPTFDAPAGLAALRDPALAGSERRLVRPSELGPVDAVLLSRDHPHHLDASARALLPDIAVTLTTHDAASRLGGGARGLTDFDSVELPRPAGGTLTVTAVPAVHGSGSGVHDVRSPARVTGFVLSAEDLPTVYISGDNSSLDEVKSFAEALGSVDTAIIHAGAPHGPVPSGDQCLVLDSGQAAEAARLLDARRVIPVHYEDRDTLETAFAAAALADRLDWGGTR
ncbi:Zn-dependent hydrolase [Streptomyces venezuelae]|uniref:Zn-dependent hydrolase n=1 Tax=Streptomyces venezuelae TaxID=54571 RepID=A0A5P2CWE4_STRVZ|nr:MBL fold metallo-hydrolase [Streptomyces venezuelae]QES47226.1 Zn-dependent hydrolase [Streptomyces venezuelae]